MTHDIRWKQRFANYEKAFKRLKDAVELTKKRELSELETQGLIHSFEYTYELSWTTLNDYLKYQGITGNAGSRDVFRESLKQGLIENGEIWMESIESRNKIAHTYDEDTAKEIKDKIVNAYYKEYESLYLKLKDLAKEE